MGETRRSLLLGPDGKVEYLLWVIRDETRLGLVTDEGRGESLTAALGRYRIRVDVDIEPETRPRWVVIGARGEYDISWGGVRRGLVIGDRPDLPDGNGDEYELARIAAGEPRWDVDIGEGAIPQETGLVEATVDFDKGCFLGQELVARIDSRGGQAPRRLMGIASDGPLEKGAAIQLGEDDAGVVTSAVAGQGLAMVKRAVPGGSVVTTGGVEAVVNDLPPKTRG